ncbi:MAG: histidine kinase N-terminal 7TM domain-containing protein [Halosimplex sp.]
MAVPLWVVGVLAVACALTGGLTVAGWRNRCVVGADWFAATMGVTTLWTAVAIADAVVRSLTGQVLVSMLGTVAAVTVPVLWFSFVVEYTGRGHLLSRRGLAAIWAVPVVASLSILAAPVSDLYFANLRDVEPGPGVVLEGTPGPVAWLNLAYAVALLVAGLWFVARLLWDHDRLYSGQAIGLLAGSLAPVALLGPAVADLLPRELPGIALGFSVLGVGYGYSLFAHRLLDLSPASRRIGVSEAFDDLGEGVVVAGAGGDVVAINDRACELFDCRERDALGSPIVGISPSLAALGREPRTADVRRGSRVFSVSVSAVRDARDRPGERSSSGT